MVNNYFDRALSKAPIYGESRLLNEIEQLKNQIYLLTAGLSSEVKKDDDEFLTEEQVCKLLKRKPTTLWRYRKKKLLPYCRLAGIGIRYKRSDVLNLLNMRSHV